MLVLLVGTMFCADMSVSTAHAQKFQGLEIGMSTSEALRATDRNLDISTIPFSGSKRILNDTVLFSECGLPFRRSLGFNKEDKLVAVGLTYKTLPHEVGSAQECALAHLTTEYGAPHATQVIDSVLVHEWDFGGTLMTLEAKAYNERDHFVLVYFYRKEQTLN